MLSFIEVKRSCFCLESTSSCFAYPAAFCMQVIYARCRWNIYVQKDAKRSRSAGDGGSWNVFQGAKYLSILTWIWVKGWCKDCKKYTYYMSCFFIFCFQKKSTRCSSTRAFDTCRGVVVPSPAIDVAAKLFEAKNSVRKPTASSNAQLSCPICGEHLRDGKETSCWKPNKMMFVLQTWKWIMAHYYSKHEITLSRQNMG